MLPGALAPSLKFRTRTRFSSRQATGKGRDGGDSDVESLGDRSDYTCHSDNDDDDDSEYIASGSDEDTIGVMSAGS